MQKALCSFATCHTGSNSGSSRFLPLMLEPICMPFSPSLEIARSSSSAAAFGACIGRVAMP